jgi:hypothetical protein
MPRDGMGCTPGYKRDWSRYNEHLVRRGELYLALEWVDSWDDELRGMNRGKRGRPFEYPGSMMEFLAAIRHLMGMAYRQMEGFLRALARVLPRVRVADYTEIWRRVSGLELPLPLVLPPGEDTVVVAIDSTGIQVTRRGVDEAAGAARGGPGVDQGPSGRCPREGERGRGGHP